METTRDKLRKAYAELHNAGYCHKRDTLKYIKRLERQLRREGDNHCNVKIQGVVGTRQPSQAGSMGAGRPDKG